MRALIPTLFLTSCLYVASDAHGGLMLELSGVAGSSDVSWEASGSVTILEDTKSRSSTVMNLPKGGSWNSAFDNNVGDVIQNGQSNLLNLSTSGFAFSINNSFEFFISDIDITADDDPGEDDVQLDVLGTVAYPELQAGDVLSWSGSGQFSLGSVNYDEYFVGGTTSTIPIDGGNYILQINAANAVPEPSSILIFFCGGLGLFFQRRKKQLHGTSVVSGL